MSLEKLVIDNIKRIRKEKNITQEKLAELCGTTTSYIGLMEIYRNVPKLSTIERIAIALDVEPLILFLDNVKEENVQTEVQNLTKKLVNDFSPVMQKILLEYFKTHKLSL